MKTTVDIPEEILNEAMRCTKAKTKREAIVTALQEMNRRHAMAALTRFSGKFSEMMTVEKLMELRGSDHPPVGHSRKP